MEVLGKDTYLLLYTRAVVSYQHLRWCLRTASRGSAHWLLP